MRHAGVVISEWIRLQGMDNIKNRMLMHIFLKYRGILRGQDLRGINNINAEIIDIINIAKVDHLGWDDLRKDRYNMTREIVTLLKGIDFADAFKKSA
jgi:hypothetical protein